MWKKDKFGVHFLCNEKYKQQRISHRCIYIKTPNQNINKN